MCYHSSLALADPMNIEVRKLCEKGQFSEAINFAIRLPKDQIPSLVSIGEFILGVKKLGKPRDSLLKELIFGLVKVGGIKDTLPLFEHFADYVSAQQLQTGVFQKAEQVHESHFEQ